ncbi:hypothetical protein BVRB_2g041960 [Beta vulgaris subsp. vulgaris]|nr:hypothetical protein BVRB_2g041960 [Beta vulgaris subsp. vulgaris]
MDLLFHPSTKTSSYSLTIYTYCRRGTEVKNLAATDGTT